MLSASKLADENYISILTPTELQIHNTNNVKITVTSDAILRGWYDPK